MKTNFFIKAVGVLFAISTSISAMAQMEVEVLDGAPNASIKTAIESNSARLLNEINDAFNGNRALRLSGLMNDNDQMSLEMLWENVHFRTEDSYIGEILLSTNEGYQLRNIPLEIKSQDDVTSAEDPYQEAVINFDRQGRPTDIYFSIASNLYKQIQEKGVELGDMAKRMEILEYVEHFRTAYNQRDINFMNQVFSDDALIITGKVIQPAKRMDGGISLSPEVRYTKQSKQEYLSKLGRIFKTVKYLNVTFDNVQIKRHGANKNIYGVLVTQGWNASNYSDEGYVFMVWDFSDAEHPQIHVRTWQPLWLDKGKTQPLPQDEIFTLNDFDGI